jgi:hypothetical protein
LIPMVDLVCPKCETEDKASIPFTKEFFRYWFCRKRTMVWIIKV